MITSTKVSVIIPCYNYDKYLVDCISSVIRQKLDPMISLEIIIVDDCSTDKTFELATEIAKRVENVKVIHNETNMKLPATRNIGIKQSTGRCIVCLDADYMLPPDYIQSCFNFIISNNLDIVYTDSYCFGITERKFTWPDYDVERLKKNNFIHGASMFRRIVWEHINGYDESFVLGSEDYDFWLMAAKKGFKFGKCSYTHLMYRRTNESMIEMITSKNKELVKEQLKKKHGDFYKEDHNS